MILFLVQKSPPNNPIDCDLIGQGSFRALADTNRTDNKMTELLGFVGLSGVTLRFSSGHTFPRL